MLTANAEDNELTLLAHFDHGSYLGVSEICYTLFRGKLTTLFAGIEMQPML